MISKALINFFPFFLKLKFSSLCYCLGGVAKVYVKFVCLPSLDTETAVFITQVFSQLNGIITFLVTVHTKTFCNIYPHEMTRVSLKTLLTVEYQASFLGRGLVLILERMKSNMPYFVDKRPGRLLKTSPRRPGVYSGPGIFCSLILQVY